MRQLGRDGGSYHYWPAAPDSVRVRLAAEAVRLWRVPGGPRAGPGTLPVVAVFCTRNQHRGACRDRLSRFMQPAPYSRFYSTRTGASAAVRSLTGLRCANRSGKVVAASSNRTNQRRL